MVRWVSKVVAANLTSGTSDSNCHNVEVTSKNKPEILSSDATLILAIVSTPNEQPGVDGYFTLTNSGAPPVGTLYIDANPGELGTPVRFVYRQTGDSELVSGTPPYATYEAHFDAIQVPTPRSFNEVVAKMNEGQFLKLGPTDKGVCTVPRRRRKEVLEFLGFGVE